MANWRAISAKLRLCNGIAITLVNMSSLADRMRELNADIEARDPDLANEVRGKRTDERVVGLAREEALERGEVRGLMPETMATATVESVVRETLRPVLEIKNDQAQLTFSDAESEVWRERLLGAAEVLVRAARATGRIEVEGHPDYSWVGTGWLIKPDVVVTNRHVAELFAVRAGRNFVFKQAWTDEPQMVASIDFVEEFGSNRELTFVLDDILHIEGLDGPDIAFLHVEPNANSALAQPIVLSAPRSDEYIATIGYPARDGLFPDIALMDRIYGRKYDKKRLAPGEVIKFEDGAFHHDCTTLGGNSGSVVLSLKTGQAVGLHFAGNFLTANYAVPGPVISERLDQVLRGTPIQTPTRPPRPQHDAPRPAVGSDVATQSSNATTYVVPLRVTVDLGAPYPDSAPAQGITPTTEGETFAPEAPPSSYANRKGYVEVFLGEEFTVPLPTVREDSDVLTFENSDGSPESVLRYEHFSVVMSQSRKLCYFSAVNIDGTQERRDPRPGWRSDSRIDRDAQIEDECYGNFPRFARGHMTRREDPIWGTRMEAKRGNGDSMHVTNACPQLQPFNAGVWLSLEDYALDNAKENDIKISVFTGPFFEADDPVHYNVAIPKAYWKVIVFIHDDTGELCATGYSMTNPMPPEQEAARPEFVFGKFKTFQRRISWIERRAGLSFNGLADLDPFREQEVVGPQPLESVEEIRFT